ncbi:hypothetical protein ACFOD0_02985 [Shewanella intestini]|uniref:Uncharacterized protein n=1 Tax=Shewanella intestini TaxID=2017544 RepID=A0ABS5I2R9_9GAMM|nr:MULTISPECIES: hypothetical protein [Shewanella]MBR9727964.1 hypothetical protein [Shewanella intestini]MRG36485.1 hypothetical protein [Shewanella sp. XMDDZSB0408]
MAANWPRVVILIAASWLSLPAIAQPKWVAVDTKPVVICPVTELVACLNVIPANLRPLAALQPQTIRHNLGLKTAMVLHIGQSELFGMVVFNQQQSREKSVVMIDSITYQLPLLQQTQLSIWHELGHLHNIDLQGSVLPTHLSAYQHEWLADMYLYWRLAQLENGEQLVWQQLHRRNLALINHRDNIGHWSAPQLQRLLALFPSEKMQTYTSYAQFVADAYPQMPNWNDSDLAEFASLVQRTFADPLAMPLPRYLFWRQPVLISVLTPTLNTLMGEGHTRQWLAQQFATPEQHKSL